MSFCWNRLCFLPIKKLRFLVRQDVRIKASMNSEEVTLFQQESKNAVTYRIPALLYIPTVNSSIFLAFAEKRSSRSDNDAEHLVLRRGQKNGASVEWGPMESLMSAVLPGHRTMNPCPVYERKSKTVFLFFICVKKGVSETKQIKTGQNAARLCYVSSNDAGLAWNSLIDLTDTVIGEELKDWATFAVGPGHGVQLRSGWLVIPAYVYHITVPSSFNSCCCLLKNCKSKPHALIFYSDDDGQHWQKGELIQGMEMVECQVAEVKGQNHDTLLYCNARTKYKFRVEATSTDQGQKFKSVSLCEQLPESEDGCQGSVVSFTPTPGDGNHAPSCLLYSHPKDEDKRKDLGIYLKASLSETDKWEGPWVLYKGPSGYSDLAVCQGQPLSFGCLFECGKDDEREKIAFRLFTYDDLQNNIGSSQSP